MGEYLQVLVEKWRDAKRRADEAKAEMEALAAEIIGTGEDTKPFGVAVRTRTGGYGEGLVPLLKLKGLGDAYKVKETPDTKAIEVLLANGVLTKDEVGPFKQDDSVYLVVMKEGK